MKDITMFAPRHSVAVLISCAALSACAASPTQAVNREDLLATAGFTLIPANTPERVTSLNQMPKNKIVQRTRGGVVHFVYADPLVCDCLYVGDASAYAGYRKEVHQRNLAEEQAITAAEPADEVMGPWGMEFM